MLQRKNVLILILIFEWPFVVTMEHKPDHSQINTKQQIENLSYVNARRQRKTDSFKRNNIVRSNSGAGLDSDSDKETDIKPHIELQKKWYICTCLGKKNTE